ncbi:MAG: hypothetical protein U0T74_01715 [Chitinophagales bacterium]
MKYLFVGIVILIQIITCIYIHQNAKHLSVLDTAIDNSAITEKGKQEITNAYFCLSKEARSFRQDVELEDGIPLSQFTRLLKNFPLHLLKSYGDDDYLEFYVLVNGHHSTTIVFYIVRDNGVYKIDGVKNLCELLKRVNLSFESEQKL